MLYNFLILRFPGCISDLERCLRVDELSPADSDDLQEAAPDDPGMGFPPHDVDLLISDTGIPNPDEEEIEEEEEQGEAATGSDLPAVTPTTPAPKRRRME